MHGHDFIANCKTDAGASGLGAAFIELFLYQRQFILWNTRTIVPDLDVNPCPVDGYGRVNFPAFAAVLCGIESNGMILASGEEQVRVVFLDPETPLGERVR